MATPTKPKYTRNAVQTFDKILTLTENNPRVLELRSDLHTKSMVNKATGQLENRPALNVVDTDTGELFLWLLPTHAEQLIEGLQNSLGQETSLVNQIIEVTRTTEKSGRMVRYMLFSLTPA